MCRQISSKTMESIGRTCRRCTESLTNTGDIGVELIYLAASSFLDKMVPDSVLRITLSESAADEVKAEFERLIQNQELARSNVGTLELFGFSDEAVKVHTKKIIDLCGGRLPEFAFNAFATQVAKKAAGLRAMEDHWIQADVSRERTLEAFKRLEERELLLDIPKV